MGAAHAAPHLELLWRKPVRSLHSLRIAPGGGAMIVGLKDGRSHCYRRNGKLSWGVRFRRPERVSVSDDGGYALAFPPMQPYSTVATLLRGGKPCATRKLNGAIVAGAMSPDGRFAGAVTARGWLYFFRRSGKTFSSSRVRVRPSPRALLVPRSGLLLVGHTGPGGVEAYGLDGGLRWRLPGKSERVYDLYSAPQGQTLGILSYRVGHGDQARALVVASSGSLMWQADVPGIFPRLALEADGVRAALGFTEVLRAGDRTGYARKIAYYDEQGRVLWQKGGLFFSPQMLGAVTPGPSVMARNGGKDVYLLGDRGGITSQYRHPATIRRAETAWDGRTVAVWDAEDRLSLLQWRR